MFCLFCIFHSIREIVRSFIIPTFMSDALSGEKTIEGVRLIADNKSEVYSLR